jgi:glutamate 5-kinase
LIILSDVEGVYDRTPTESGAKVIPLVKQVDDQILGLAQDTLSKLSKGGMGSKLRAARMATAHGHAVVIAGGRVSNVIDQVLSGEPIGTLLLPGDRAIRGRKRWIGWAAEITGTLRLDAGATNVIQREGRSLLPIGIIEVIGDFHKGAVISMLSPDGQEIARGLSNYSSAEVRKIMGKRSDEIPSLLGYSPYEEVVHRDNLVRSEGQNPGPG